MDLVVTINSCYECQHVSHTGAFTPGGAKPCCCDHPVRVRRPGGDNCFKRVIRNPKGIPKDCPLKQGAKY